MQMSRVAALPGMRSVDSTDHKFTPAWWLPGPHPQTLWSQFFRRTGNSGLRRERVPTPDADNLLLYHSDVGSDRPRVLILHGLEGSEQSHYVAGFVSQARRRG